MSLPAWSGAFEDLSTVRALPLPGDAREWAWGGSTGAGIKVAVVDSGVDGGHPAVGGVDGYVATVPDPDSESGVRFVDGKHDDLVGHGTACAGIIRSLAPDVEIYSVRVLGENLKGKGALFLAGIEWAIDNGMDVVNMSLSSKSPNLFGPLHDVADDAYFGNTVLVCAANNAPGPTYPSQFASVVSVAATSGQDPYTLAYNPNPPVEFAAIGIDIEVPWTGGSIVATGNSFAAPHVAGLTALIRAKHPDLTAFQVKAVLHAASQNAR
ncbi:MAG: serine protease [Nocardioides sp.]|jgi:subtilisin family serine protease|nr:serine protease [Nocardioides sp.]